MPEIELFRGKSPAGFFSGEYKRVTKQNLPPSVDVGGVLLLTNLHGAKPDGLDMVDRVFMANGSYQPILLGARAIRSFFAFRPYLELIAKSTAGASTPNQDLLMKNILAITSGQVLREGTLCPTFSTILWKAVEHRDDLVKAALSDMQAAHISYVDRHSEAKMIIRLAELEDAYQAEQDERRASRKTR